MSVNAHAPCRQGDRIWRWWLKTGVAGEAWLDSKRGFSVEALPWKNSSPALPRSLTLGRIMPAITRQDNARHNLHELLLIALCTILTGGKDCSDMALFGTVKEPFLRQFLRLRHGIPSHDTFSRVFRLLDPAPFEACFTRFMQRFAETLQGVVAIDGKTLRRSLDRAAGKSPLHMLHAWSVDQRLLLGQLAVDGKSNEITAVPKLLDLLSLKGRIVTADALNCQRTIAASAPLPPKWWPRAATTSLP